MITDESDEQEKTFKSILIKSENLGCVSLDSSNKVKAGFVKVKRKLFFYKKRFMILLDNGTVVFARKSGRIRCNLVIGKDTEIIQIKSRRFQIKTP